ncbi:MAG: hypothetical protein NTW21_18165 [Verrucomicrobia bacterium]|nr:hypothetical protein [Verrucomicrobiota bacterium]
MAYQTFSLPVAASPEQAEAFNAFLRGHSVVVVRKEWVAAGPESFWACYYSGMAESFIMAESFQNWKKSLDQPLSVRIRTQTGRPVMNPPQDS